VLSPQRMVHLLFVHTFSVLSHRIYALRDKQKLTT